MLRIRVKRFFHRHAFCSQPCPVKRRCAGHNAVEVVRISLRFHHRLPTAARAAAEIAIRSVCAVVTANHGLGHFSRPVHREKAEVYLRLQIIERPTGRVAGQPLVAGVGPNCRITLVDRIPGAVLHRPDESAAAAHDEPPVPRVRQQQFKTDGAANDTLHINEAGGMGIFLEIRCRRRC